MQDALKLAAVNLSFELCYLLQVLTNDYYLVIANLLLLYTFFAILQHPFEYFKMYWKIMTDTMEISVTGKHNVTYFEHGSSIIGDGLDR